MKISGCTIVREIARGGYGTVYLARSADTGEFFALKKIRPSENALNREYLALEFYIEKLKKRRHPNIVEIIDCRQTPDCIEYLMPLADSATEILDPTDERWEPKTLAKAIDQRRNSNGRWFSEDEISKIFIPIISAAMHIAERGLLHRDIKPENILFINGKPVLSDLGLVAKDDLDVSCMGTPIYTPPSWYLKTNGNPDMWGLSITLYALATGNPPDTLGRPAFRYPSGKTLSKEEVRTWNMYHKIIARALSENPNERFFRLEDMLDAFVKKRVKEQATRKFGIAWPAAAFLLAACLMLSVFAWPAFRRYWRLEAQATRAPYEIVENQLKKSLVKSHTQMERFLMYPNKGEGLYYKDLKVEIPPLDMGEIISLSPGEAANMIYKNTMDAVARNDNKMVVQYVRAADMLAKTYKLKITDGETFQFTDEFLNRHMDAAEGRTMRYYDMLDMAALVYPKALFNLGQPHLALKEIDEIIEFIDKKYNGNQEMLNKILNLKGHIWQFTGNGLRPY